MALDTNQVLTGTVRFSYSNVFTPHAAEEGAEPKYGVTLLIPKTDKTTMAKIQAAIESAKAKFKEKTGKDMPAKPKLTLHDGDGEKPLGGEYGPECAGCYVITASNKNPPKVLDSGRNEILDKTEFYSGCYGRAIISFFGYDNKGKGIAAGLEAVQKTADGEPLGGSRVTADDFDEDGFIG